MDGYFRTLRASDASSHSFLKQKIRYYRLLPRKNGTAS